MVNARPAVAAALVAALVVAGSAEAATKKPVKKHVAPKPKPVCDLVTDKPGDANGIQLGLASQEPTENAGPSDDVMDILSADVAANPTTITGVVRLKKLAATDTSAPSGINWSINFTIGGVPFSLQAYADPTGAVSYTGSYVDPKLGGQLYAGNLNGTFDTKKSEIHISIPTDTIAKQAAVTNGTLVTAINAAAGPEVLVPEATGALGGGALLTDNPNTVDQTANGKDYKVGTLSCVTPGK